MSKFQISTRIYKWSVISCVKKKPNSIHFLFFLRWWFFISFAQSSPCLTLPSSSVMTARGIPTRGTQKYNGPWGGHLLEASRRVGMWFYPETCYLLEKRHQLYSFGIKYSHRLKKNSNATQYAPSTQGWEVLSAQMG